MELSREQIEKTVEEISLLVVMLHDGDQIGLEMILESCRSLLQQIEGAQEYAPLQTACSVILQFEKDIDSKTLLQQLRAFSSEAQAFLRDPSSVAFSAPADHQTNWGADLAPDFDRDLIGEFVSKHSLLLDEFELELLSAATRVDSEEHTEALDRFVRAYLHNIKGDAGTVGLRGIADVTHQLESLLTNRSALRSTEQLVSYKEWVSQCLQACSKGEGPPELSPEFIVRLQQSMTAAAAGLPPKEHSPAATAAETRAYAMTGDTEVLSEFLSEAEDHLGKVEEVLLDNRGACSEEHIAVLFRAIHSVKGGSSYFGLQEMTDSSHVTESLLDDARNGTRPFTAELADLLLNYIDLQKVLFERVRSAQKNQTLVQPSSETPVYLERIHAFLTATEPAPAPTTTAAPSLPAAPAPPAAEAGNATKPSEAERTPAKGEKLEVKNFLKVEAGRLDLLIEYIGELVISSSMLTQRCRRLLADDEAIQKNAHQLEQILREVQFISMSMRLVPVKGLFQKMARLVWDTSKKIGKQISFEVQGEETELDRTVIEKIADPLMHMVRNSIDHGIEPPEERERQGKPRQGRLKLCAFHRSGSVHIQIIDDGRGLDHEKIRMKAVEKGLVSADQVLSKQELWQLIFAPGFSTAAVVTDISGRGVGMDVVRRNIESMRGRVLIDSQLGEGTTFTIELPLTLAIIDGIETAVGPERFVIPTLAIVEFINPSAGMLSYVLDKGEMLRFRETLLPLFRLAQLFGIENACTDPTRGIVVVVESAGERFGLLVDEVIGKHSTVIKSLGMMFEQTRGLAGCAIMPDGYVGLILDAQSLLTAARTAQDTGIPLRLPPREQYGSGAMTQHAAHAAGVTHGR